MIGKSKKNIKSEIEYGSVDIDLKHLQAHEVKIRISTMIDEDILTKLKAIAKDKGTKYQTLLNSVLRSFVETSNFSVKKKIIPKIEDTVRRIVREEIQKLASNE